MFFYSCQITNKMYLPLKPVLHLSFVTLRKVTGLRDTSWFCMFHRVVIPLHNKANNGLFSTGFWFYNQLLSQLRYHQYKCNPFIYFSSITHLKGAFSVTCFCTSLVIAPSQSCRICTLTALIRVCHTSVNSGEVLLTRLAFCVHAGHVHSGMDSIAMEGASNVNVPPWRMGSLERNMSTSTAVTVFRHRGRCPETINTHRFLMMALFCKMARQHVIQHV